MFVHGDYLNHTGAGDAVVGEQVFILPYLQIRVMPVGERLGECAILKPSCEAEHHLTCVFGVNLDEPRTRINLDQHRDPSGAPVLRFHEVDNSIQATTIGAYASLVLRCVLVIPDENLCDGALWYAKDVEDVVVLPRSIVVWAEL